MTYFDAETACAAINESLLTKASLQQYKSDFLSQLSYVEYAGYVSSDTQMFWLADNIVQVTEGAGSFKFFKSSAYSSSSFPALCTQTQGTANVGGPSTPGNELTVQGENGNQFIGFRNQKVFLFQGIRYAQFPGRFNYSAVYQPSNQVFDVTGYGSQCYQFGSGAEDCFFLNIWTPYIPKAGSTKNLRAVLFWIHGGGYVGGSGAESDGGDLAAREDVVVVGINYRLGNFGFFAAPGYLNGNYGTGDQITALEVCALVTKLVQLFMLTLYSGSLQISNASAVIPSASQLLVNQQEPALFAHYSAHPSPSANSKVPLRCPI